jgi:hypothetical protein
MSKQAASREGEVPAPEVPEGAIPPVLVDEPGGDPQDNSDAVLVDEPGASPQDNSDAVLIENVGGSPSWESQTVPTATPQVARDVPVAPAPRPLYKADQDVPAPKKTTTSKDGKD